MILVGLQTRIRITRQNGLFPFLFEFSMKMAWWISRAPHHYNAHNCFVPKAFLGILIEFPVRYQAAEAVDFVILHQQALFKGYANDSFSCLKNKIKPTLTNYQ